MENNSLPHALELSVLRANLVRLEETIIFALIERTQFAANSVIYDASQAPLVFGLPKEHGSFADFFMRETEILHAKVRRYTDPEEHQFFDGLPSPILAPRQFEEPVLMSNSININSRIMELYRKRLVPRLCREGDDGHYGSSVTIDVAVLQALSKRIHYGKFVAESKYRSDPKKYTELALSGDWSGILDLLTNAEVEANLLKRVRNKAMTFGADVGVDGVQNPTKWKVDPDLIVDLYKKVIIPLTKDVEVMYLIMRAGCSLDKYTELQIDY